MEDAVTTTTAATTPDPQPRARSWHAQQYIEYVAATIAAQLSTLTLPVSVGLPLYTPQQVATLAKERAEALADALGLGDERR